MVTSGSDHGHMIPWLRSCFPEVVIVPVPEQIIFGKQTAGDAVACAKEPEEIYRQGMIARCKTFTVTKTETEKSLLSKVWQSVLYEGPFGFLKRVIRWLKGKVLKRC